ncbi:MAG: 50S ribosomal protein L11 methyltransferase [Oscillospiraceae bacterium]|nr:50S ribosomal protein L11 methyltransferase [Oscillospiraceae bacterium]
MNWTKVDIFTATEGIDMLCTYLMELGIRGFSIQDPEDFNEFLENKDGKWDYIEEDLLGLKECESCVTVYLPEDAQGAETMQMIKELLARLKASDSENIYGRLEIQLSGICEEDWANNWKQYFKPFCVGEKLYIKPSWEDADCPEGRTVLEIDPASSFGTGQHHTTRLCLELMENEVDNNTNLLDLGCGSGILFIGGMLLGAERAFAVDIEENASRIAMENAEKNNLSPEKYTVRCGNILTDESLVDEIGTGYDLICANIVADVLKAMAPVFPGFLKDKGILIISGIISERRDEVVDKVKQYGFKVLDVREKEGWAAVKLIKA